MVTNSGIDQNWKEDKRRILFSATTAKYSALQITDVKVNEKVSFFFFLFSRWPCGAGLAIYLCYLLLLANGLQSANVYKKWPTTINLKRKISRIKMIYATTWSCNTFFVVLPQPGFVSNRIKITLHNWIWKVSVSPPILN